MLQWEGFFFIYMSKNYFSHDYNARNDEKVVQLQMKHGMLGIGVYWCLIEMLAEESGYLMLSQCQRIAFELRTDYNVIESVINDFGLFHKDDVKFWSESLLRRLKVYLDKSQHASEMAHRRWEKHKGNTKAMPKHSQSNATKVKESKVKESKVIPTREEFLDYCKTLKEVYKPELNFALTAKYNTWVADGWKTGFNKPIINWKNTIANVITHLKPVNGKFEVAPAYESRPSKAER